MQYNFPVSAFGCHHADSFIHCQHNIFFVHCSCSTSYLRLLLVVLLVLLPKIKCTTWHIYERTELSRERGRVLAIDICIGGNGVNMCKCVLLTRLTICRCVHWFRVYVDLILRAIFAFDFILLLACMNM